MIYSMTPNELYKHKRDIRGGQYTYTKGDMVYLSHRKSTGYPRNIKDDETYIIHSVQGEFVFVHPAKDIPKSQFWNNIKVHKYYILPKIQSRDRKIDAILDENNK